MATPDPSSNTGGTAHRPLRLRIQQAARQLGITEPIVEKDYALSYLLAGVAGEPDLRETLVFKGGTALKKLLFREYRFSEDLDFSSVESPKDEVLMGAIERATERAGRLLEEQGSFRLQPSRYRERDPHPGEQEAFVVGVQFPWHPQPLCRIKIEVTHDEPVL